MLNHILYTKHDCTTVLLYVYEWWDSLSVVSTGKGIVKASQVYQS